MHRKGNFNISADSGATPLRVRQIKAIPTKYKGHFYRSRLEARWSVFFDVLRLKFEYEPEGFDLSDGTRYLPDFYLPEVRWFAEIKPNFRSFGKEQKPYLFTKHTGLPVLMLDGEPALRSYTGIHNHDGVPDEPDHMEMSLDIHTFQRAFIDGRLWADPDYERMYSKIEDLPDCFSIRYRAAVLAASEARFER